ncbi:MAG: hypothetical protein PHF57_04265 [Methanoregula sp.]|nr:hypothetical protein [Methanoregula sp.]
MSVHENESPLVMFARPRSASHYSALLTLTLTTSTPKKPPVSVPNPPIQQPQSPASIPGLKPRTDTGNEALGRVGFGEGMVRQGDFSSSPYH